LGLSGFQDENDNSKRMPVCHGYVNSLLSLVYQGIEKKASGRQPRPAAFWKEQHIQRYVNTYKSRTTLDHGLRRGFSTPC
jgi:hypothetical protein